MLDFFDKKYQKPPINDLVFGLYENNINGIEYLYETDKDKWIATAENPAGLELILTVIDKGVITDNEYSGYKRCDGMLTSYNHLYFIELKNQKTRWKEKGISQLASTIELFNKTHPKKKDEYMNRKAYVCNKKHPYSNINDSERKIAFLRDYNFRLHIEDKINII